MADQDTTGKKLVESITLTLMARLAMLFATIVGLPVAGWMMNRAVQSVDKIADKIEIVRDQAVQTSSSVRLIQQQIDDRRTVRDAQFNSVNGRIDDHEGRIRSLERPITR